MCTRIRFLIEFILSVDRDDLGKSSNSIEFEDFSIGGHKVNNIGESHNAV